MWIRRLLISLVVLANVVCCAGASPQETVQLVVQRGHSDRVLSVAFSPDGRTLASGSADDTVRLWDVASGKELRFLTGPSGEVDAVAFSPDGRTVAGGSGDGTVCLWDVASGRAGRRMACGGANSLAFSPDGLLLASGGLDNHVHLWEVVSGRETRSVPVSPVPGERLAPSSQIERMPTGVVNAVRFSPDGRTLATAIDDGTVRLWDVASGREVRRLSGHAGEVLSVAFSPDGDTLASGSADDTVRLWDLASGRPLLRLAGHALPVSSVAFSPDGRTLASGGVDNTVCVWDVASGRTLRRLERAPTGLPADGVWSVAFSPDGTTLASGNGDTTVRMWDVVSGRERRRLSGHASQVRAVAFSPDGRTLATGSTDLHLWSLQSDRDPRSVAVSGLEVAALAFSPDGIRLATGGWDNSVHVRDAASGRELRRLTARCEGIFSVAFNPQGRLLASGGGIQDGTVRVWDAVSGQARHTMTGQYVAFCADGRTLATASGRQVRLWDEVSGRELRRLDGPSGAIDTLAFSPDGHTVATGDSYGAICLWDAASGRAVRTLSGHAGGTDAIAFSPDSRLLASGGGDDAVCLWDVSTGQERYRLTGHSNRVSGVAFSPDGRTLASASADTTVWLWDVTSGQELVRLVALDGTDWLAVTPDGFFDGSPGGWQKMLWRFNGNTFDTAVPEQFFNDFYQPGLLQEVVKYHKPIRDILKDRGDPRAALTIVTKDRRLPQLAVDAPDTATGPDAAVKIRIVAAPGGVRDVRLFNNGTLVTRWSGPQELGVLDAMIPVVAGANHLVAYAFNHDDIKSPDATAQLQGPEKQHRVSQAYVLAIGIDRYADPRLDLDFAVSDARALAATLRQHLPFPPTRVHVTVLSDEQATRQGILQALSTLASIVHLEDTVLVSYSGHGMLFDGHFYLVPHDMGTSDQESSRARHGVSDTDLEAAFLSIESPHMALILDSCHSGGALDSDEWRRGPMNSRGLVQLAWEKGMGVVTAAQSQQVALELAKLGHGLLTAALVNGLDRAPRTAAGLLVRDWLDFGRDEVPRLLEQRGQVRGVRSLLRRALVQGRDVERLDVSRVPSEAIQLPRVFHRREESSDWIVAGRPTR